MYYQEHYPLVPYTLGHLITYLLKAGGPAILPLLLHHQFPFSIEWFLIACLHTIISAILTEESFLWPHRPFPAPSPLWSSFYMLFPLLLNSFWLLPLLSSWVLSSELPMTSTLRNPMPNSQSSPHFLLISVWHCWSSFTSGCQDFTSSQLPSLSVFPSTLALFQVSPLLLNPHTIGWPKVQTSDTYLLRLCFFEYQFCNFEYYLYSDDSQNYNSSQEPS